MTEKTSAAPAGGPDAAKQQQRNANVGFQDKRARGEVKSYPRHVPLSALRVAEATSPAVASFRPSWWTDAPKLVAAGYDVVPIAPRRKACYVPGWPTTTFTGSERSYTKKDGQLEPITQAFGTGIKTGAVVAIDIDVNDAAQAEAIERVARITLGIDAPRRIGKPPKRLLVYRTDTPRPKTWVKLPGEDNKVEILGVGQQFVAAAVHPDTGKPYVWTPELPPFAELPLVTSDEIDAFVETLKDEFGGTVGKSSAGKTVSGDADLNDPVLRFLIDEALTDGVVRIDKSTGRAMVYVVCPWKGNHSCDSGPSETVYMLPRGEHDGCFKCLHAGCAERFTDDFLHAIGYTAAQVEAQFEALEPRPLDESEPEEQESGSPLLGYFAYLPQHQYIDRATGTLLPGPSIDGHLRGVKVGKLKPSAWLDKHRAVHQMTWDPGRGEVIEDEVIAGGGWQPCKGKRVYNTYRPPPVLEGNPDEAGPWLAHLERIYPDEHEHIVKWFAHRVQYPGVKCNHALVLGGSQGIGKDTLLEPVKVAVGRWNWEEISPAAMIGRFNSWVKSVVVRINEARDLGDIDRFKFYDHSKSYIAAPPDVLRVDEKHLKEYAVLNVMGVIITTNHKTDGIYLPADDRRHFVAWSTASKEDFEEAYWARLWAWYEAGGYGHVAAYLRNLDLSTFDPKAPPPKTEAFHAIVAANIAPTDSALGDLLESIGNPPVVTIDALRTKAMELALTADGDDDAGALSGLFARASRRQVPHLMERAGYVTVRNPNTKDGRWKIAGKNTVVYGRQELSFAEQVQAIRRLGSP